MTIQTERLELIPLTPPQLKRWIENPRELERELRCSYRGEPLEGFFRDIVKGQLEACEKDSENSLWHSFWFLLRKSDRTVVGSAAFKDIPNKDGEVEIGYGLGKDYEHKGYMTEAVKAMCKWALEQETISAVIAETELDGFASQRILERCGFEKEKTAETLWWKLRAI